MSAKNGKGAGFIKALNAVDKIADKLPDTAQAVAKVVDNTANIVDKALDRQFEAQQQLIDLPNVVHLPLEQGKAHLEMVGFHVLSVLAKPDKKWLDKRPDEIVQMEPKPGKFKPGTLVKLYYVTDDIIEQSDGNAELPILKGMFLTEAITLAEKKGFEAAKVLAKAKPEFAKEKPGLVIDSDPKPNLLNKVAKTGTTIRIIYLDETVIAESLELLHQQEAKKQEFQQNIDKGLKDAQKAADNLIGNIGGLFQKRGK